MPAESVAVSEAADIYPEYRDVMVPPNIAPLNFMVRGEGDAFVCQMKTARGAKELVAAAGDDGKIIFDTLAWRELLAEARGGDI